MAHPSAQPAQALTEALARLNKALETLENRVDATKDAMARAKNPAAEVQRMANDRARLAQQLDDSQARAEHLAKTNSEVSRRLVSAMETVRQVLDE
ncbi:MAG: DUF4164 domain-containing protein [Pseudomonadota bacterium]